MIGGHGDLYAVSQTNQTCMPWAQILCDASYSNGEEEPFAGCIHCCCCCIASGLQCPVQ